MFYINPIYLVMNFYGIIVLSIMGAFAFRQKKRGKVLNVLGIVYIGYIRSSLFTIHFTVKCAGAWPSFISPLRMIAAIRLCAHIIIIYNDIHARAEPAGILQKIRV